MKLLKNIFSISNENEKKVIKILGIKIKFSKFKLQKIASFRNNKPTIAMQLNCMDKGGLEEVVLELSTNKEIRKKYNIVIITERSNKGYLAKIARKSGIPVYSFFYQPANLHKLIKKLNIKIVHFHYNITGVEEYKDAGVRTIYTIHNNYIWFDKESIKIRNEQYKYIDKFIAVSSQVKEFFCDKFDVVENKVSVITNGIEYFDTANIVSAKKTDIGLSENDFVLLNIASFNPIKYQFAQVETLSRLKNKYSNIKLVMLANIPDRKYYNQFLEFINESGVENNIKILNYAPKNKVYEYLKMADCFIMTSLSEGFSIAKLEAMLFEKPMILTDVGGARDVIKNNDIGIIVKHAFNNLQALNVYDIEKDNENRIYHLDNVEEIVNAIEDMYVNKQEWIEKGKLGKEKIINEFNVKRVCQEYLIMYNNLNIEYKLEDIVDNIKKEQFDITIIAPYPSYKKINEGWMSRISAIDNIMLDKKRLYINPCYANDKIAINQYSKNEFEIRIKPTHPLFSEILKEITCLSKLLYCHTLHLAEYLVPVLDSNKVIVDIHGIAPEEEVMLGNPHLKEKYEKIEEEVLQKAKYCVMVSNAMKIHYKNKYPNIKPHCIILPIVEKLNIDESLIQKVESPNNEIIYSGGTQVWQNIDGMLNLAKKSDNRSHYIFLSHDFSSIKKKAKKLKITNAKFEMVSKKELKNVYKKAHYGLILREDSPVNFVCCPTKLYEYMACGIIPIVRTIKMGDFTELGFKYVTENDLLNGTLPNINEKREMILTNFVVVKKMQELFEKGAEELKNEISKIDQAEVL